MLRDHQGVSARLGLDELAAVGHLGLARHVVVRARLRLLLAEFSRDAIEVFNRFVEPSGQVVEYVRGVSGFKTSYELNINDDTPLHLIAILHHYNATLDDAWVHEILRWSCKIADYLLSQRDANGLDLSATPRASTCSGSPRGATSSRTTRSTAR